jgi:hypothetical protein
MEMKKMNKKLKAFIEAEKIKNLEYLKGATEYHQKNVDMARRTMFPDLLKAIKTVYIEWLKGFVNSGNTPTHYYDYPFDRWDSFYMAKRDFELVPLYGASAINIIVPYYIKILGGQPGHSNVFCYDGYKHYGIVPVFSDTIF